MSVRRRAGHGRIAEQPSRRCSGWLGVLVGLASGVVFTGKTCVCSDNCTVSVSIEPTLALVC